MNAAALPNHALCHLRYTRKCGIIIADMVKKSKGKRAVGENLNPLGGFRGAARPGIMRAMNSAKELSK